MGKGYMKHRIEIILIVFVLIASALCLLLIWGLYWRPFSKMTELGYQERTPVAKTTKPITVNGEEESTQYYVLVEVDTQDGPQWAHIEIEEAYGEEDFVKCLNYCNAQKTVDGYFFYSEPKRKVYFSKEIATAQEYMESKAKGIFWLIIGLDVATIVAFLLTALYKEVKLPVIPGSWTSEQLIVCRYSGFGFGVLTVLCIALGAGLTQLSWHLLTTAANVEAWLTAMMFPFLALMFLALGVMIVLFMKNFALVFYPEGVVYRDLFGKTWTFAEEQIKSVWINDAFGEPSFHVRTKEKNIWVTRFSTNYSRAEEYVKNKYSSR